MRRIMIAALCVLGVVAIAMASPAKKVLRVAVGTLDTGTNTTVYSAGYVEEIVIEKPAGATSADITVKVAQPMGNEITLADKTVTATTLIRPRVAATDAAGTVLVPTNTVRYFSVDDTWTVLVTNSNPTGAVWRVWIKSDDGQ